MTSPKRKALYPKVIPQILNSVKLLCLKNVTKAVLRRCFIKNCSESMQQGYKRDLQERLTTMPKWDFSKVAKHLYWNHILVHIFRTPFPKSTSGGLLVGCGNSYTNLTKNKLNKDNFEHTSHFILVFLLLTLSR